MKKRILCFLLFLAVSLSALGGCNGQPTPLDPSSDSHAEADGKPSSSAPSLNGVALENFVIVCDLESKNAAKALQNKIQNSFGYDLPLLEESALTGGENVIFVGEFGLRCYDIRYSISAKDAANGAKLPFTKNGDDKAAAGEAQQRRMNGEAFKAPKAAGSRLGEIINKATAFNAHERYQSMDELKAVLDSCVKNLYLKGVPSAESIFNKNDDDLSAVERMMVNIIEKEDAEPEKPVSEPEEVLAEETPAEEAAAEEDVRIYEAEEKGTEAVWF